MADEARVVDEGTIGEAAIAAADEAAGEAADRQEAAAEGAADTGEEGVDGDAVNRRNRLESRNSSNALSKFGAPMTKSATKRGSAEAVCVWVEVRTDHADRRTDLGVDEHSTDK